VSDQQSDQPPASPDGADARTQQIPVVTDAPGGEPPPGSDVVRPTRVFAGPSGRAPGSRSLLMPALVVGLALVLVVSGVLGILALSASRDLHSARVELAAAASRRARVAGQLRRARSQLGTVRDRLAKAQQHATAAEQNLTSAQQTSDQQRRLISDLRSCLNGVVAGTQALQRNDPATAQAVLAQVKPTCDSAYQQAATLGV